MNGVKKLILFGFVLIFGVGILLTGFFTNSSEKEIPFPVKPVITKTISGDHLNDYLVTFGNITFNTTVPESPNTIPVYNGVMGPGGLIDESNGSSIGDGINVPLGSDAYEIAIRELNVYGGLPSDAVPSGATTSYAELVNRTTYEVVRRYAEDTMVSFTRRINGRYIMGDTDIIRVLLGDNGRLIWVYKEWRNYTYAGDVPVIPVEKAIKKLENGDTINQYLTPQEEVTIYNITLGYYVTGLEDPVTTLEPVWIFSGDTSSGSSVSFKVYARQFANFTATPTSGKNPLNVTFTDTSETTPNKWFWNFGDGTNSTAQNPAHQYAAAGTYNVSLKVWNDLGSDTMEKSGYITLRNPTDPVIIFTTLPIIRSPSGSITFNTTLPGGPSSLPVYQQHYLPGDQFSKDFGSNRKPKQHLTSEKDAPEAAKKAMEQFGGLPPDAQYQGSDTEYSELQTRSGELIEKEPILTNVYYGKLIDGLPVTGNFDQINLELGENGTLLHIYKSWSHLTFVKNVQIISASEAIEKLRNGETVSEINSDIDDITIYNISPGYHESGKEGSITEPVWFFFGKTGSGSVIAFQVYARKFANFTAGPTSGKVLLSVTFTDTSETAPNEWFWDFGDGTSSTEQNPAHTYAETGTYNVSLMVRNDLGSDTMERVGYIYILNTTAPVR